MKKVYNIYLKLTNACQLHCDHCYNAIMHNSFSMGKNIVEKSINFLRQFRKDHPEDKIQMSLHGGEPLLYDIKSIQEIIDNTKDLDLYWSVTTNLVYSLTEDHFKLFNCMEKHNDKPLILTSWDYDIRFKDSNELSLWENNIKDILAHNIDIQPIVCLTNKLIENVIPKDLFNYIKSLGLNRLNFERITDTGRAVENKLRPNNKDMRDWLYQAYIDKEDIFIPLFEGVERSINGTFLGCRARHCMENVITINPDGTIAACPNTANKQFGDLDQIDCEKRNELIKFERQVNQRCLMCNLYKYCKGDCCQLTFDETGCPGLKEVYEKILFDMNKL